MKTLLIIPSGGGIKTFLCTPFVEYLRESGEVWIWHALPEASVEGCRKQWTEDVHWEQLPQWRESLPERVARQAKAHAQIHWKYDDLKEILLQRLRPGGSRLNRVIGGAAGYLGRLCGSENRIQWLDGLHDWSARRAVRGSCWEKFLSDLKPDVVFCTYQRAICAVPGMAAARNLGIPTAAFIYSWDNLPKGRITVPADYYLVWSDFMKQEVLEYYPQFEPEQVLVVGTPQFEHYANRSLLRGREDFLGTLGLRPDRPVVCFSGDDVKTSPYDPEYLGDLARALRETPAAKRPQVLFRPCPTDHTGRFDRVLKEFGEIVESKPLWASQGDGDWATVMPAKEDIGLLCNIVFHSDVVVNVGSTMAMDFAVYNKPGIYIAYNPANRAGGWDIETIYRLPHFKSTHELQPVYWARSAGELGQCVQRALSCPEEKSEARGAWLNHHVCGPLGEASRRCADALRLIAGRLGGELAEFGFVREENGLADEIEFKPGIAEAR